VLTRRAQHLRLHPGEIAFPGGKVDPGDRDHWHTALREAEEEIELPPEVVQPLGLLPSLVTRTDFEVVPCVALLREQVAMRPNLAELDLIFRVPLSWLAEPGRLQLDDVEYRGQLRRVPRFKYDQHSIWGVTAAMLVKLVNITCDAGLVLEDYWKGEEQ
jgi:8-oxo-dGTP pyrophosphatase MutT (NUDIX family)